MSFLSATTGRRVTIAIPRGQVLGNWVEPPPVAMLGHRVFQRLKNEVSIAFEIDVFLATALLFTADAEELKLIERKDYSRTVLRLPQVRDKLRGGSDSWQN